jgi:hypothetical protein
MAQQETVAAGTSSAAEKAARNSANAAQNNPAAVATTARTTATIASPVPIAGAISVSHMKMDAANNSGAIRIIGKPTAAIITAAFAAHPSTRFSNTPTRRPAVAASADLEFYTA